MTLRDLPSIYFKDSYIYKWEAIDMLDWIYHHLDNPILCKKMIKQFVLNMSKTEKGIYIRKIN